MGNLQVIYNHTIWLNVRIDLKSTFFAHFICCCLVVGICCRNASAEIIAGPFINPANGNIYYLLERATWAASQAEAVSLGGNLVTIRNIEEQVWLQQTFGPINTDFSPNSFWIGYTDQESEGTWKWISGEPVTFIYWQPGEPNGGNVSNWAYVGRYSNGRWNDIWDDGTGSGQPQPRGVVEILGSGPSVVVDRRVYHAMYIGDGTPPWNRIDTNKRLLKQTSEPQVLTFANLINTSQGINGIIFDILNLPEGDDLSAEDFEFQVSPVGAFDAGANPPANWQSAPAPSSITVTTGSPDRVLIQWPDQSIMNRWLRITVLANEETGLAQPETYYIGHLLGETTGPTDGVFTVSFADITSIRSEVGQTVDASSITDIDKNGTVSFADISAMRGNVGSQLTQISVP